MNDFISAAQVTNNNHIANNYLQKSSRIDLILQTCSNIVVYGKFSFSRIDFVMDIRVNLPIFYHTF